jgi:hypothetical protein
VSQHLRRRDRVKTAIGLPLNMHTIARTGLA